MEVFILQSLFNSKIKIWLVWSKQEAEYFSPHQIRLLSHEWSKEPTIKQDVTHSWSYWGSGQGEMYLLGVCLLNLALNHTYPHIYVNTGMFCVPPRECTFIDDADWLGRYPPPPKKNSQPLPTSDQFPLKTELIFSLCSNKTEPLSPCYYIDAKHMWVHFVNDWFLLDPTRNSTSNWWTT